MRFEASQDAKKRSKDRRNGGKGKATKEGGKKKAPAPQSVTDNELTDDPPTVFNFHSFTDSGESFFDINGNLLIHNYIQYVRDENAIGVDDEGFDEILLPSNTDDWDTWTKIAFKHANSQVFLKLASWMLVRYRQLTQGDLNGDIPGVVIGENPRMIDCLNDDHFFEALGMERLYSAIAHIETRPRYMCHLFHALGKVIAESDVGSSNPRLWASSSPPSINAQ